MRKDLSQQILLFLVGLLLVAGWLRGQESKATQKTFIHSAAWSAKEDVSKQDMADLKKASAEMVGAIPGLRRVWMGKLRQPLVIGNVTRNYGFILEFDDVKSREGYSGHPNRAHFAAVWDKVRVPGVPTHSFDVSGE